MSSAILLVAMLVCGAVGLFLAMPGGRRNLGGLALLLLLAAVGTAIGLSASYFAVGAPAVWFVALAVIGLLGAVRMITHKKPVYSALYFILVVVSVVGQLTLMEATFLAAAVLLIYAGAILVTYVFVIMLAQQREPAAYDAEAREPLIGCIAGFALLAVITARIFLGPAAAGVPAEVAAEPEGSPLNIGVILMTNYVIAVQLAGVILLAAMVGAIAIARRKPQRMGAGETD